MTDFISFFKRKTSEEPVGLLSNSESGSTTKFGESIAQATTNFAINVSSLPKGDARRIGRQMRDVVTSDKFVQELSNKVGTPRPNESKEEFLRRCKAEFSGLVRSELDKR